MLGPIASGSLSEEIGRAYIYKTSLLLTLIFTIVAGSASAFRTIVVARAVAGLSAAPCVVVFAGLLNDLWAIGDTTGSAMLALYGLAGVTATEVGPVAGAAIVRDRGWRWSFWLTAMLLGVCLIWMGWVPESYVSPATLADRMFGPSSYDDSCVHFLPIPASETVADHPQEPEILRRKYGNPRPKFAKTLRTALLRPIDMFIREPIIPPTAAIVTVSQTVVYIFYAAFPHALTAAYQFSPYELGLAFLPLLVGSLLSLPVLSVMQKRRKREGSGRPELIMEAALVGSVTMPIGLYWYVVPCTLR
jgi:MFS family permease